MGTVASKFYVPTQVCSDTQCFKAEVPWVTDLGIIPLDQLAGILVQPLSTSTPAGVYVRSILNRQWRWRLVLSYYDYCDLVATAGGLKIVTDAVTTQTFGAGTKIYKNGQLQAGTVLIPDGSAVFNVVFPAAAASSLAGNILGGAPNELVMQVGTSTTGFITAPTGTGQVLTFTSTGVKWVAPGSTLTKALSFSVTGFIPANSILDVTALAGPYTLLGTAPNFGTTNVAFNAGRQFFFDINGLVQTNAVDVVWVSTTQFRLVTHPLYSGDTLNVTFT